MKGFLKTIINSLQTWTKKQLRNGGADWNQNDPNKPGYVRNRPFFEENGKIHKLDKKFIDIPRNVATTDDIQHAVDGITNDKMDKSNPVGTGSFSMNRRSGTTIGAYSHAEGNGTTASGNSSHAEGYKTQADGYASHAEGYNTRATTSSSSSAYFTTSTTPGYAAHAEGYGTIARGAVSHAEGNGTTASGNSSHAEGYDTDATGDYSHAEGYRGYASGNISHAEGAGTTASGNSSHAEGNGTTASGNSSHAEGASTTASGGGSHSEGWGTTASGSYSHAEGHYTTAQRRSQHVKGEYNILDTEGTTDSKGKYVSIVGNGISISKRSNAHTLDWNGVGWYQGGLQVGGNAQDDGAKNVLLEGDAIPVPTSATTGQILAVKTVDENGKPTEWEAVDTPQGGEGGGAVKSVNGKTGVVELTSEDVDAQPKTLVVTLIEDDNGDYIASHSASEIAAYVASGGDAYIVHDAFLYRNDGGDSEEWWFVSMRPIVDETEARIETEYIGVYDDKHTTFGSSVTPGIDNTLTISGQTADAKAVGDALNGKLDKSGGTLNGNLTLKGSIVIPMDGTAGIRDATDVPILRYDNVDGELRFRLGQTGARITMYSSERPLYNGNEIALKSEIPTDDHINDLINTALGVIENGTY